MSNEWEKRPRVESSVRELHAEDLDEENLRIFQSFDEAARQHSLVVKDGIYRFKEDPAVVEAYKRGNVDLNALIRDVHFGRMPAAEFLKILRDTGSSLDHYASVLQTPGGIFHGKRSN
ncbi:MAG: hypothetical protein WC551_07255 [Patescibacteria group bacterium]